MKVEATYKIDEKVCLVKMESKETKYKVMGNKTKLKNWKERTIFINDDITREEREIQKPTKEKDKKEEKK